MLSRLVFRLFFISALAIALTSCADANDMARLDSEVIAANPGMMQRISTRIGKPDEAGRIGRNRSWGGLYSVRFQYGSGRALRYGVAVKDDAISDHARRAIRAGLETVEPDGAFSLTLPDHLADQFQPGLSDQASAAAFFLSDICPALIIAGTDEAEREIISQAMQWLSGQSERLMRKDAGAPNRLLINALAFQSCGKLLSNTEYQLVAEPFVDAALDQFEDGIFIEAGGSDTSYQSVSLVIASDLLALDYNGPQANDLRVAYQTGGDWLAGQIGPDGRLDSSQNTRSCAGEDFLSRPKDVDLTEVYRALAYRDISWKPQDDALVRYETWLKQNPNPCS